MGCSASTQQQTDAVVEKGSGLTTGSCKKKFVAIIIYEDDHSTKLLVGVAASIIKELTKYEVACEIIFYRDNDTVSDIEKYVLANANMYIRVDDESSVPAEYTRMLQNLEKGGVVGIPNLYSDRELKLESLSAIELERSSK